MQVKEFFDSRTSTLSYVVWDAASRDSIAIDPVLDYDPGSSTTWTESLDAMAGFIHTNGLLLRYVLETHAHADHLSGAQVLTDRFPEAKQAIGERITVVQSVFKAVFDLPEDFPTDGRQFDRLLRDGEMLDAGAIRVESIFTPGHTPACVCFRIDDLLFTGDALLMPDAGTGRCDFPGGSARELYGSITRRLYTLPDDTRVFVGHDYQPGGRELRFESTIGEQKRSNVHLNGSTSESEFVEMRTARDRTLSAPRLLYQSVQVNVDGGALPKPGANGVRFLKIPVNAFRPSGSGERGALEVPRG